MNSAAAVGKPTSKNPSRKLRVGVLRGGPSDEYELSLKTGKNIIDSLRQRNFYIVQDIFIDRSGVWHIDGLARPVDRIFPHVDVVVNGLHGAYGEDGRVQQILESHGIPYTGSGPLGSAMGMNKPLAKKFFKSRGLLTPEHVVIKKETYTPGTRADTIHTITTKYPFLKLVKPASTGSSLGVNVAHSPEEFQLAIDEAFTYSDSVLIEEYINGREATCGVVEGNSVDDIFALHPIEINDLSEKKSAQEDGIWSYESRYNPQLREFVSPANFTPEQNRRIQQAAVDAHKALDLRHYSKADFKINRRGIYLLEVDSLPDLVSDSVFPKALSSAEISFTEFLDHIINLALQEK